ncbi:MAG: hypothetical protein IPO41_14920 [Acidobacteria bacterium]|nr:hypothetical protein [Acidobacteriota bacterium]
MQDQPRYKAYKKSEFFPISEDRETFLTEPSLAASSRIIRRFTPARSIIRTYDPGN